MQRDTAALLVSVAWCHGAKDVHGSSGAGVRVMDNLEILMSLPCKDHTLMRNTGTVSPIC